MYRSYWFWWGFLNGAAEEERVCWHHLPGYSESHSSGSADYGLTPATALHTSIQYQLGLYESSLFQWISSYFPFAQPCFQNNRPEFPTSSTVPLLSFIFGNPDAIVRFGERERKMEGGHFFFFSMHRIGILGGFVWGLLIAIIPPKSLLKSPSRGANNTPISRW